MKINISVTHFIWLVPFVTFLGGYLLISLLHSSKTHITPTLVGQNITKILLPLSQQNLNVRVIGHKDEADLAQGTILSQTPSPGTHIKENQALYLVIAQKPSPLQTPNLQNKDATQATQTIESVSLKAKVFALPSDVPHNQCLAQYPNAGMPPVEQSVIVYTSQPNAKPVIMPNLKAKNITDVVEFLSLHGIKPDILHTQQTPHNSGHQCTHCTVIDQRPLAGTLISLSDAKPIQVQLQVG